MQRMEKYASVVPGLLIAVAVAAAARFLEGLLPIHLIGASVIALFIGMGINALRKPSALVAGGLKFTSKRVLKLAIILLGASLSMRDILTVGRLSLMVMCFTLLTCFGGGYLVGRSLGLNWKLSNLISAGTGICGGSAIAAIAPVIDAQDRDIAYAMSATFLFDMVMILMFPFLGHWLGMSDMAYGLWAGTAVNDTSSVVAAGYAFSEAAGDFATMVKLTHHSYGIDLLRHQRARKVPHERGCGGGAGQRAHALPVVYPGFPGPGAFQQRGADSRRGFRLPQGSEQVPHGGRAGRDRPEHRFP